MLKKILVKGWYQGSTLTACGQIATTKIRNHRNLGNFSNNIWIANLQGKTMLGTMANGLTMRTNCLNPGFVQIIFFNQGVNAMTNHLG